MLWLSRGIVLAIAGLLFVSGLIVIASGDPVPGMLAGGAGLIGLVIGLSERMRYHAEVEESETPHAGPVGALDPGQPIEPRFRRTDEVFLDPTTTRRVRVFLDPATGERRYRAED